MQQLGATLGSRVRRLFRGVHSRMAPEPAAAGRKIESELLEWVSSRVAPAQLGQLMYRQQCRAYSRAAGFHATCELLLAVEGAPPMQCKVLSTLAKVLRPLADDAGASVLCSHYSRDVACAGPHAGRRLRLAFAATLEQLVKMVSRPSGSRETRVPVHQQLALTCILHMELRLEDLPIQARHPFPPRPAPPSSPRPPCPALPAPPSPPRPHRPALTALHPTSRRKPSGCFQRCTPSCGACTAASGNLKMSCRCRRRLSSGASDGSALRRPTSSRGCCSYCTTPSFRARCSSSTRRPRPPSRGGSRGVARCATCAAAGTAVMGQGHRRARLGGRPCSAR